MKTKITYNVCTISVVGMEITCPFCKTLVKSGQTHHCEGNKPKTRKARRGK